MDVAVGGRASLTSSVVRASGAYDSSEDDPALISSSDSDAELQLALSRAYEACAPRAMRDNDPDDDPESDECETLIYDSDDDMGDEKSAVDNLIAAAFPSAMTTSDTASGEINNEDEDGTADLLDGMERLKMAPPKLGNMHMSVVVQFWSDQEDGTRAPQFVLETDEIYLPLDAVEAFCDATVPSKTAPYRMALNISPRAHADEDVARVTEIDAADGDDDRKDSEPGTAGNEEPEFASTTPNGWIPTRGRVNVLAVLYAQAPVIVGLLSERYDLDDDSALTSNAISDVDDEVRTAFNGNGKRIRWIDGAIGVSALKRSRVHADPEDASSDGKREADIDAEMTVAMTGISTPGVSSEWTTRINSSTVVCGFERDDETGRVMQARVALGLHTAALRDELQAALDGSRNTM